MPFSSLLGYCIDGASMTQAKHPDTQNEILNNNQPGMIVVPLLVSLLGKLRKSGSFYLSVCMCGNVHLGAGVLGEQR